MKIAEGNYDPDDVKFRLARAKRTAVDQTHPYAQEYLVNSTFLSTNSIDIEKEACDFVKTNYIANVMAVSLLSNYTNDAAWKILDATLGTVNMTADFEPKTVTNPFTG